MKFDYIKVKQDRVRWIQIEKKNGLVFMRCKQRKYFVIEEKV